MLKLQYQYNFCDKIMLIVDKFFLLLKTTIKSILDNPKRDHAYKNIV